MLFSTTYTKLLDCNFHFQQGEVHFTTDLFLGGQDDVVVQELSHLSDHVGDSRVGGSDVIRVKVGADQANVGQLDVGALDAKVVVAVAAALTTESEVVDGFQIFLIVVVVVAVVVSAAAVLPVTATPIFALIKSQEDEPFKNRLLSRPCKHCC